MSNIQNALINACKISKDPTYAAKVQKMIEEAKDADGQVDHNKLKAAVNNEYGSSSRTISGLQEFEDELGEIGKPEQPVGEEESQEEKEKRVFEAWKARCEQWAKLLPFYYTYHPMGKWSIARGIVVAKDKDDAMQKVIWSIHKNNASLRPDDRIKVIDADVRVELMDIEGTSDFVSHEEFWD